MKPETTENLENVENTSINSQGKLKSNTLIAVASRIFSNLRSPKVKNTSSASSSQIAQINYETISSTSIPPMYVENVIFRNGFKSTPDPSDSCIGQITSDNSINLQFKPNSNINVDCVDRKSKKLNTVEPQSNENIRHLIEGEFSQTPLPPSYSSVIVPNEELTISDVIMLLKEVTIRFNGSEQHLISVLSKYIHDKSLKNQLVETITAHFKLQIEVERKIFNVSKDMWFKQIDTSKTQEKLLKDALDKSVQQNKQLQEENESLHTKIEELLLQHCTHQKRFLYGSRNAKSNLANNPETLLSKNNERLRNNIQQMKKEMEDTTTEMAKMQKNNITLTENLKQANMKIQDMEDAFKRLKDEKSLECSSLIEVIKEKETLLKDNSYILENFGDIVNSFINTLNIDMPKVKTKTPFRAILDQCSEIMKEVENKLNKSYKEIEATEKENQLLQQQLTSTQEKLSIVEMENSKISEKIESTNSNVVNYDKRVNLLESELEVCRERMNEINNQLETEKNLVQEYQVSVRLLQDEVEIKKDIVSSSINEINDWKIKAESLQTQLDGIGQLLVMSGAGDVAKELGETKSKFSQIQSEFYQLLSENKFLSAQICTLNKEKESLVEYQKTYYEHLQLQQNDLNNLSNENSALKEKIEKEKAICQTLRLEMSKHNEENAVLKSVYQQLKSETHKVQKLESTVVDMNMETNRLVVIAEYNKKLGEKLYGEIAERDQKISELQKDLQMLNNIQTENNDDKVALCMELNQVCTLKEELSKTLNQERKKLMELDKSKKESEKNTNFQLQAIEEMQKKERMALKELLKDHKNVVRQRDALLKEIEELSMQVHELQKTCNKYKQKCEDQKNHSFKLEKNILKLEDNVRKAEEKSQNTINIANLQQENTIKNLENKILELEKSKEDIATEKSQMNLNYQKLHQDLNLAREVQIETQKTLKIEIEKNENVLKEKNNLSTEIQQQKLELNKLLYGLQIGCANYEKVSLEYKQFILNTQKTENKLRKEVSHLSGLVEKCVNDLNRLMMDNTIKNSTLKKLKENQNYYKESIGQLLEHRTNQQMVLKNEIKELKCSQNESTIHIQNLIDEIAKLSLEKEEIRKLRDEDYCNYKTFIEDFVTENEDQKREMYNDLHELSNRLKELNEICSREQKKNYDQKQTLKNVTLKLLLSVRLLINEKMLKQTAEVNLNKFMQESVKRSAEFDNLAIRCGDLRFKCEEMDLILRSVREENRDLQNTVQFLSETNKNLNDCKEQLEIRVNELESKIQDGDQDGVVVDPNVLMNFEELLKESRNKLDFTEERAEVTQEELIKCQNTIIQLRQQVADLNEELTEIEFKRTETQLQVHKVLGELDAEKFLNQELLEIQKNLLQTIATLQDTGDVTQRANDELTAVINNGM